MIKFNFEALRRRYGGQDIALVADLYYRTFEFYGFSRKFYRFPKKLQPNFYKPLPVGNSFLLNEVDLLQSSASPHDMYDYIWIASKRNYEEYRHFGDSTLPYDALLYNEERQAVKLSPIMKVKDNNIIFLFE